MTSTKHTQSVAAYDNAPFFEKALKYAIQQSIIDQVRIAEIISDAATGSIQIAEYFGESFHLRKSLETSKQRMVSLVSLYLEASTGGDLNKAALLLKEKPFRALSRGGSQMLKALYSLPEDNHFGSPRLDSEREFLKRSLNNGLSVTKYGQTFEACERFKRDIDFATVLAKKIGVSINQLNEHHVSAEQVIRTLLLSLAYGAKKIVGNKTTFLDEVSLFEIFKSIRKEFVFLGDVTCSTKFIDEIPAEFQDYASEVLLNIKNEDISKVVNQSLTLESVFNELKNSQYFYLHDELNEVSRFDKGLSAEWFLLTGGTEDDALLLTLFLCAAAGIDQKTMLKTSDAKNAVLNIRQHGLLQHEVMSLINKAPFDEVTQLKSLWSEFIEEALPFLLDSSDKMLNEVIAYLVDRCNIQKPKK
jgi:hypothetical protein